MKVKFSSSTDGFDDSQRSHIDHVAVTNMNIDNARTELDDFAYMLLCKLQERIQSLGMPIGNKLTSFSLFEFNNTVLIKYQ